MLERSLRGPAAFCFSVAVCLRIGFSMADLCHSPLLLLLSLLLATAAAAAAATAAAAAF
jgi:hypothetical protein